VTGLLCGTKVRVSSGLAGEIEKEYNDDINADGARRYAWIYPTEIEGRFKEQEAQLDSYLDYLARTDPAQMKEKDRFAFYVTPTMPIP
jgi:hypothetical protein